MSATYTYSITNDTLNGVADTYALEREIIGSSIIIAIDHITMSEDVLDVVFKGTLGAGDETTLDSVVAAHTGVPVVSPDLVKLTEEDPDTGGVMFSPRYAPQGWTEQLFELEFTSCKDASIHEKDWMDNDIGYASLKFYDNTDTEITDKSQANLDANCVRTDLLWMPNKDYMIKGGWLGQITPPTDDIFVWALGADLDAIYGGPQSTFLEGGLNMQYIGERERTGLDGVAGTILYYNHPALGDGAGTNRIRFVVRHPLAYQHRLQAIFDIFTP